MAKKKAKTTKTTKTNSMASVKSDVKTTIKKSKDGTVVVNNVINNVVPSNKLKRKWLVALILSILLGWFGIDRFYMGHGWLGFFKLITFGGLGIWWIIDIIMIATKSIRDVEWV